MAINPAGAVASTLDVFGSLVTEMSADSLPEGVSPDNQDVIYSPGQVGGRTALDTVFDTPFPGTPTCVSGKSFVTPTGDIKNLYWNSDGSLYVEDLTNAPGVKTLLLSSTPNCYFKSITAFGNEFIAISDGLHGQEIPLQYDGVNVDRVTQYGPGAPPSVTNIIIPPTVMQAAAPPSPTTYAVTTVQSSDPSTVGGVTIYTSRTFTMSAALPASYAGQAVTLTGSSFSAFDDSYVVDVVLTTGGGGVITSFKSLGWADRPPHTGSGGLVALSTSGSGSTIVRASNTVTITTTTPHGLQVGFLAQISGVSATDVGGGITSIVIKNEDSPGIATITTATPHGLVPQSFVTINDVTPVAVGGGIVDSGVANGIITITTASAHGLSAGSIVNIAGTAAPAFGDGQWAVISILSPTMFTYATIVDAYYATASNSGTVSLVWPLASADPAENVFEVIECPSDVTFQVGISYPDGVWASGDVSFSWDGTFYVTAVPTTTTFQYQQYGPDAMSTDVGIVTPSGQAAPGKHLVAVAFLDRQGGITEPSPFLTFVANGGQYIGISNLPIGPPNIVARIILFTGALGSKFFYIPVPAQVNGQVVSTATQISDNTTTSAILDFSDNTLFAALGTSIPGNNLSEQIVLDSALGFGYYDTRLITNGQRNCIQTLLNMDFNGGYLPSAPTLPTGWVYASTGGALGTGRFNGFNWQITGPGLISQSMYENCYGSPIATGNTQYYVRYYLTGAGTFVATMSSASLAFSTTATITFTQAGWYEATFTAKTPLTIPTDFTYSLQGTAGTFTVDEGNVIYSETPYLDTILYSSYGNNPQGIDGLSGKFGPVNDTRKVMDYGIIRDTFYMLTREPSGRLHETSSNGITEPSGWTVNEVAGNCGALSAFSVTKSQADDSSAAGGEEWLSWASSSGARIFSGDNPYKISQEIQPNWFDAESDSSLQINMAAALTVFAINDPIQRVIYYGLPIGTATAPSLIYPVNYRELDTAYAIANSPPYHPSLGGKLIATDNTRKWTRWNMTMNGMARMYRSANELTMIFFGGNALALGAAAGFGNIYSLNPAKYTDDDYGQINPYYITYFAPSGEEAQALQLDQGRKMLAYQSGFISALGNLNITILCDRLSNPWPIGITRQPGMTPNFDLEWSGAYAQAQRMATKIASSPITGTDNTFSISTLTSWFRKSRMLVRGASQ